MNRAENINSDRSKPEVPPYEGGFELDPFQKDLVAKRRAEELARLADAAIEEFDELEEGWLSKDDEE